MSKYIDYDSADIVVHWFGLGICTFIWQQCHVVDHEPEWFAVDVRHTL